MRNPLETAAYVAGIGIGLLLVALVLALPVFIIWNHCLVDAVTWANPIGFWQALGFSLPVGLFAYMIAKKDD